MTPIQPPSNPRFRTFEALSIPDFRRLFIGHGISLTGTWLQGAAVAWLVFDITNDERMLGVVEAANLMPGLFVGLLAGAAADKTAPRSTLLTSLTLQMLLACALAWMTASGQVRVWPMIGIVALSRVCVTFEMPSRQIFVYELVGKAALLNAIALNAGLFNASRVVGPSLAGVCLWRFGPAACFALNAASFLAVIFAVGAIRGARRSAAPREAESGSPGRSIWEGFAYLGRNRKVGALFLVVTLFGALGMGYSAMLPAFAKTTMGAAELGYSLLLASVGVGATCGALFVASSGGMKRRDQLAPLGIALFAIFLALTAWLPERMMVRGQPTLAFAIAAIGLMGVGFGGITLYSSIQTMIQTAAPDRLRGRIMGVWMVMFSGSVPLGALIAGASARSLGVTAVMLISSFGCLALAAVVWRSDMLEGAGDHDEE